MNFVQKGLANIDKYDGLSLSIAGMGIVFFALAFIAFIIMVLPYFLVLLDKIIPEKIIEPKIKKKNSSDDSAVIAAIAGAIYKRNKNVG
jgi:Na+-transporting methylmalonyl-CoA/oxaloacetate decarboxylase gamma subunit